MKKKASTLSGFALVLASNYRDGNARLVCINQINHKLYNNWRQLIVQLRVSADKCKHVDFNKRTRGAVFVPSDQVEQVRAFQDSYITFGSVDKNELRERKNGRRLLCLER